MFMDIYNTGNVMILPPNGVYGVYTLSREYHAEEFKWLSQAK